MHLVTVTLALQDDADPSRAAIIIETHGGPTTQRDDVPVDRWLAVADALDAATDTDAVRIHLTAHLAEAVARMEATEKDAQAASQARKAALAEWKPLAAEAERASPS